MPLHKKYLWISVLLGLMLCLTQIMGSTVPILGVLGIYLVFLGWCCIRNCTMPILLFFLPWSPILRINPDSYSFYTFGLILICAISLIKKRFLLKRYHIAIVIVLAALTLFAKLLDGNGISFSYIAFLMLIMLFPVVKEEWKASEYDFYQLVVFFSAGAVMAALCAKAFASAPNISRYIEVHSYLTITRMCGFYEDPNFYAAQITAALSGVLLAIVQERKRSHTVILGILTFLLMYCGFLSGSKSFVLVAGCTLILWALELLRMRGRLGLKTTMILCGILITAYIATSEMFRDLIQVLVTRFSHSATFSDFTTGRTELWLSYFEALFDNPKLFFLGTGFTNVKINDRSSHNTLLQMLFQFGLLGSPILLLWSVCFFRDCDRSLRLRGKTLSILILLTGCFLPWMAIDTLFFDEYFLFQMFVFIGIQRLRSPDRNPNITHPNMRLKTEVKL